MNYLHFSHIVRQGHWVIEKFQVQQKVTWLLGTELRFEKGQCDCKAWDNDTTFTQLRG